MSVVSSMFAVPDYEGSKMLFTAVGVFVIWAAWGKGRLTVKYLSACLSALGLSSNWLLLVEFLVTMSVGVVVAIAFFDPQTARQAIAAGMGWTSLVARPAANLRSERE